MHTNKHPYHLVNPSPWPISVSAALLGLTIGGVSFFHSFYKGIYLITFSFILVAVLAGALFLSVFLSTKFVGYKKAINNIIL